MDDNMNTRPAAENEVRLSAAEPMQETANMTPKKGIGTKSLIKKLAIAIAVGVAAIGGVAAAASIATTPVNKVLLATEKTVESVGETPIWEVIDDVLNGGSIEVSMNTDEISDGYLDMDVVAKLYTNLADKEFAVYANADVNGSELSATAWVDEKDIVVECKDFLDEIYGLNLEDLEENLEDAYLLEMMGIDSDELIEMMELSSETGIDEKTLRALEKDLSKLLKKTIKQFGKSLNEHAEIEKGKEELDFNGEEVNAKTIEISLTGEELVEVVCEVAEYLRDSKDLEALLDEYAETVEAYFEAMGQEIDVDVIIDEIYEALDEIVEEAEDFDDADDYEFCVVAYLNSGYLVGFDFSITEDDEEEGCISVRMGPTLKELKEFRITLDADDDGFDAAYTVEKDDSEEYEAKFKLKEGKEVVGSASISWDKKSGDYECKFEHTYSYYDWWDEEQYTDTDEYSVSGTFLKEKGCYDLEIEDVAFDGDEYALDICICFDPSDKQPSKPRKYIDILTIDEDDLSDLQEDILDNVRELEDLFQ